MITTTTLGHTHTADHVERLVAQDCRIDERTTIEVVSAGKLARRAHLTGERTFRRSVEVLVLVGHRRPSASLIPALRRKTERVHVIGNADALRTALHAFRQGDGAGRAP